jgi:hypothetical protein
MALATVYFRTYEDRSKAEDKMYSDCGGYKSYSETSGSSERPYGLYITDECENVSRARQICDMYNGEIQ